MPATTQCTPCCPTTQTVNVPGGEGIAGVDGSNGLNAFTALTAGIVVPAVGAPVTLPVVDSSFAVVGQILIIGQGLGSALANPGPMNGIVVSVPGSTSIVVNALGYTGDVTVGTAIDSGAVVSPSATQPAGQTLLPLESVYGSGTAYTVTNAPALVAFGTQALTLTLAHTESYLLGGQVRFDFSGTTYAANHTITILIKKNGVTTLPNTTVAFVMPIVTTLNGTIAIMQIPATVYSATAGDVLQVWCSFDVAPGAGSVIAVSGNLTALPLF